ncbi:unnamed protein product [Strongylus vulgaris]|uniref:Uncharacterized protein n=1 Tax=Strongylus vulgaris TaxID=40348 RepID=A0A3P7J7B7_STRVU|nr:unnamed protein product [Strongylus vulgaris]
MLAIQSDEVDFGEEGEEPGSGSQSPTGGEGEPAPVGSQEPPIELSTNHPQIQFVLQFQGEPTEDFLKNLQGVVNSANMFLWGAKKRAAAQTASWKDLAKRVTTLQTEGFDVLAGSEEAKKLRIAESQKHFKPPLIVFIESTEPKKKKKKKATALDVPNASSNDIINGV